MVSETNALHAQTADNRLAAIITRMCINKLFCTRFQQKTITTRGIRNKARGVDPTRCFGSLFPTSIPNLDEGLARAGSGCVPMDLLIAAIQIATIINVGSGHSAAAVERLAAWQRGFNAFIQGIVAGHGVAQRLDI